MGYTNSFGKDQYRRPRTKNTSRYSRATPRRRRPRALELLGLGVLVAALFGACVFATSSLHTLVAGAQTPLTSNTSLQSTPKSAWQAGSVPELYQKDPAWSQGTYAGDTFGETGCGPTCLSMVYIALTGRNDRTPLDMGALAEKMGCATPDGTAWSFMTEGAAELGLVATELPADENSIRRRLTAGSPIICSVGPGDFTSTGHFIVVTGINHQGRLIIRDPNSPESTAKTWDIQTVLNQCRGIWSYTI